MKYLKMALSASLLLILGACSMNQAKTAGDFRQATKGVKEETVNSKLSYSKLTSVLKNRFNKCMSIEITFTDGGSSYAQIFRPTTKFGKTSGTAYLQIDTKSDGRVVLGQPEMAPGGRYIVLADVKKQGGASQMRIVRLDDLTADNRIAEITAKMMKSWAKGESLNACPNY